MSHIDDNPTMTNTTNHVQLSPIYNYMQQQQQQQRQQQQQQPMEQTQSNVHAASGDIPVSRGHALKNNNSHIISNHNLYNNQNGSDQPAQAEHNILPQKLPLPLLPQKQNQHQQQLQKQQQSQTISPPFDASSPPHDKMENLSTTQKKFLLSTSSPEGIQVASKITPTRLANLLIRKGPLPIRHITAQLTLEVPSFELLSLSKQRRLIMAAMEQVDPTNNVVFEKIGWGQWAVRKVDSDYIVTEGTEQQAQQQQQPQQHLGGTPQSVLPEGQDGSNGKKLGKQLKSQSVELEKKMININDLRNQTNLKLGWSKKKKDASGASDKNGARRESITNPIKNLHNIKLPNESIDNAIASDSEDEEENEFNELEEDEVGFDDDDDDDDDDDEDEDEEDDISGLDERLIRNGRHRLHDHQMDEDEPSNSSDQDAILDDDDEEMFAFDDTPIGNTSANLHHRLKSKKLSPPLKFANRVPSKISPPPISSTASSYDSKVAARRRKSSSSAPSSVTKPSTLRHYHATHHPHHTHLLNNPTFISRSRLNSIENLDNYIASTSSGRNSTVLISLPPPAIAFSYSSAGLGVNGGTATGSGEVADVRSAVFGASPVSASNASPVGSWGSNNGNRHYVIHNEEAAKANKSRRKSSFNESHERSTLNSIRQQLQSLQQQPKTLPRLSSTQQQQHHHHRHHHHQRSSSISSDTDEEDWQSIGPEFLRQKKLNGDGLGDKKEEEVRHADIKVEKDVNSRDGSVNSNVNANEEEKSAAFALVNLMSV